MPILTKGIMAFGKTMDSTIYTHIYLHMYSKLFETNKNNSVTVFRVGSHVHQVSQV